jgi:hypothetical protein
MRKVASVCTFLPFVFSVKRWKAVGLTIERRLFLVECSVSLVSWIVGDKRYFMSISQWFGLPL